jgi:DNA-binding MarR family transcriptional regulator
VKSVDQVDSAKHKKMLEVLAQFRIVFKAVRRHYGEVRNRSGISGAQLWALSFIAERPGVKVGELAAALAIHASTASNLVRDLKALSLVEGQRHGTDQRTVNLNATTKGLQVLKRAPRPLKGVLQHTLSDLPIADLAAIHLHLSKLIKSMNAGDVKAAKTPLSDI